MFEMKLRSCGNPDFGQYAPISDPKKVVGETLEDMVKAAEEYREFWNLGGGNWVTPVVKKNGKAVAWISYNGRLWNENPDKISYS